MYSPAYIHGGFSIIKEIELSQKETTVTHGKHVKTSFKFVPFHMNKIKAELREASANNNERLVNRVYSRNVMLHY